MSNHQQIDYLNKFLATQGTVDDQGQRQGYWSIKEGDNEIAKGCFFNDKPHGV